MTPLLAAEYDYVKLFYLQNVLAILGGAVVGFFAMGFLTGFFVRGPSGQGLSAWLVWVLRIMGALLCASLVALFLLGPGGAGWGGGTGTGTGDNTKDSPTKDVKPPEKDKDPVKPPEKDKTPAGAKSLFIEVLMNEEVKEALGEAAASDEAIRDRRYYRERGSKPQALLTLKEVREKLQADKPPYATLFIVLGKNRSDKDVPRVKDLKAEADRLRIFADYTAP
jgi:hypothetical protein